MLIQLNFDLLYHQALTVLPGCNTDITRTYISF